ncbi:glycosyltransferase [Flavobacterium sp. Arc2]|jgi:glycosyltransferase involved in cell wall biosynthesis|uniref:glycosyltransferase n=1 Tax=Flavobacterium sp. Arc2 TaxID=3046685 RepID=UPI00352F6D33
MRIVQIIDSLEAGGAERMAVNYANGLADHVDFSGLIVTRKEGVLLKQISEKVPYFFLKKKKSLDFLALCRLRKFVSKNKVEVVHAHSTSYFIALLLKLVYPSVKIIWHDHYGDSEFLDERPTRLLKIALPYFSGILVVNQKLKNWAIKELNFSNSLFLPNFVNEENYFTVVKSAILHGVEGKRIVCLANLRFQKNHFLVLRMAEKLKKVKLDWTFHLVGKDFKDEYSTAIKKEIIDKGLSENVFIYDSQSDIATILEQSTIAILSSQSEGLPVALLEYGLHRKPVLVTDVGEIATVVIHGKNGLVIALEDEVLFYDSLLDLINDEVLREQLGNSFYKTINEQYNEQIVIKQYVNWLKLTIKND